MGLNQAGINKKRKKEIQNRILEIENKEENMILTNTEMEERVKLQTELLSILEIEELYWFKRSHETWLLKGDNNTEFYHRVANGRRRKNMIFNLQDGDNNIQGTDNLLQHATEYYKFLFGRAEGNAFELDPNLWDTRENVNEDDNRELNLLKRKKSNMLYLKWKRTKPLVLINYL